MIDRNPSTGESRIAIRRRHIATTLVICALGAALIIVAEDPLKSGQAVIEAAMPSAEAGSPESTPRPLPSSAQAKSWDHVTYGPNDFEPASGTIEY